MANSLIFNYVDEAKKKSLDKAISFIDVLKDVSVISYDDTSIRQEINDVSSFAHNIYVPGHISELMNDAGYLNADDVSVFVTKEELDAKNYLTEHQSLDGYAKNADINIHLNNLDVSVEAAIEQAKADVSTAIDNVLQTLDLGIVNVEQYTDDKVLALNNDLSAVIAANKTSASNDLDYAITRVRGDFDASFLALEAAKQDSFIVGNGLALEDGILSTTIDTTLFRIVNELPASDIDETKIYLVASHNPVLGDVYTEHIHADGGWEKLGEFKATTDLSGYYNKTEVDNIVANVAQAIDASIAAVQNGNDLAHAEIDSQISALQAADASIQASVDEKTQANASAIQTLEGLVSDHKAITDSNSAAIETHDASIIAIVAKEASDYSTLASLISSNESAIADTNQKVQQNADAIAAADASLNENLANLATTVAGKASAADLEALQTTVNSKANSDDLSALATSIETKAEIEDVSLALSGKADADDLQTLTTVVQGIQDIDAIQDASIASLEENDAIQDASIESIVETIANLWNVEEESDAFDYIYDEATWNDSYTNGFLKKYYDKYPSEDLYNETTGAAASFNDKQYEVKIYSDANGETLVSTGDFKAGWVSATVQKITNVADSTVKYFIPKDAADDGIIYELFTDNAMSTSANLFVEITGISYPGFTQSWQGAVSAPGAKFPWICPNFDEDVNASIKFRYEGLEDALPWGYKIFGKADGHKEWGIASAPEEFENNGFLIPDNQGNGKASWAGTAGDNNFDITKFKMILVKTAAPESTKVLINSLLCNYASKSSLESLIARVEALENKE